jgi:hypothetical protein
MNDAMSMYYVLMDAPNMVALGWPPAQAFLPMARTRPLGTTRTVAAIANRVRATGGAPLTRQTSVQDSGEQCRPGEER